VITDTPIWDKQGIADSKSCICDVILSLRDGEVDKSGGSHTL